MTNDRKCYCNWLQSSSEPRAPSCTTLRNLFEMLHNHFLEDLDRYSAELPKDPDREISAIYLKNHVMQNVRKLFGQKGVESQVDIVKYNIKKRRFIVRCESDNYVRLRAALTLASEYEGEPCVYVVHRATANILSLAADSRSFVH